MRVVIGEWENVICEAYREVPRLGRKSRIGGRRRERVRPDPCVRFGSEGGMRSTRRRDEQAPA